MLEHLEKMDFCERMSNLKKMSTERYNILPEECHIGHLLLEACYEEPDFLHQIDAATGGSQTNSEVASRSCQLASALRNSGMKPGDSVVIMGKNHLELTMPYYASHYNGYAICTMDSFNGQMDIVHIFSTVKPTMVFCPTLKDREIKAAISSNNLKCGIVTFDGDYNIDAFIKKFNGTEIGFRPAIFDQNEMTAWLMMTSGTTGLPKVCICTFKQLIRAVPFWWAARTFRLPVIFVISTAQWLTTMMYLSTTALGRSTRVQTSKELDSSHLREVINKYKPTTMMITPFLLRKLLQEEGDACDMSSFVVVLITGNSMSKELLEQFRKKCRANLLNPYGMTELIVPIFKFMPGATPEGSVGMNKPELFKYKIVDDDENEIKEPNQVGELWVKGEFFFKGYLNNPEETEKVVTPDGWIRTGDLFSRDENNFFFFKERRRVLIKNRDHVKIAPMEIEEVIRKHPGVADVCVVGVLQPELFQLPVAAIMKRHGGEVEPRDIFNLVKESLPELKQLHGGLFFVDSLPMTPSGKINRSKVLELAIKATPITSD